MDDAFWLRACIVNPRTSQKDIEALIEITKAAGQQCAQEMESKRQ